MGIDANRIEYSNRDLWRLIIPLVVEQLLTILVGMVDAIMVSQVGEAAISAVSLVDMVNVLLTHAFTALGTGGAVIAGQYLGRRDGPQARHAGSQLLVFMVEVSFLITAFCYLGKGLILGGLFGQVEPDVAAYADTYYMIVESSIPFVAIYSAGAALFRVMGSSKVSMWVSTLMNIINVIGNAILIFGFGMGVEGVAIPTLVSRMIAAGLMIVLLRRPDLPLRLEGLTLRLDGLMVRQILRFGVVNGLENSLFHLGRVLLLSTVSTLGTAAVAANAIGNTVTGFQHVAGTAVGLALVTVTSHCVGAKEFERSRYYTKKLLKYTYILLWICVGISWLAMPLILRCYNVSDEARATARQIIWLYGAFCVTIWPNAFVLPQALRAAGDTRFVMTVAMAAMWILRVGMGVVLVKVFHFGVLSIWFAMFADWVVRNAFFIPRFRSRKWESKGVK